MLRRLTSRVDEEPAQQVPVEAQQGHPTGQLPSEPLPLCLQAVVLTSLTTLGGVFPLAYGLAGEAGWIQPMVFALGWGLLFATLLTLFLLPCLLLIIEDGRRIGSWLWGIVHRRGEPASAG